MSHIWMRQWGFYRNVIRMRWECCKNPILISVYLTDIPSHFQNINESCHTYQCNPWMSYVSITRRSYSDTHMNLSYHTHEWVMSLIWMSLWTSHVSIARRSHGQRTSGMKETYKRDLCMHETRPIKETYICMKRCLHREEIPLAEDIGDKRTL